jgi:hypothetical protein
MLLRLHTATLLTLMADEDTKLPLTLRRVTAEPGHQPRRMVAPWFHST